MLHAEKYLTLLRYYYTAPGAFLTGGQLQKTTKKTSIPVLNRPQFICSKRGALVSLSVG